MMAQKQLLHELLKEDQEPFQLHTYIAERRSQLNKYSSPIKKRDHVSQQTSTKQSNPCLSHHSPEVRTSPFVDFPSPDEMSHCKSSTAVVVLTTRIKKHQQSIKLPEPEIKGAGFGLFGSFLKILKHRSKTKERDIRGKTEGEGDPAIPETRFCSSPFRFSLRKTPPSAGRRTPDICSPVASPVVGRVNKEKESYNTVKDLVLEDEEEQCSPVSVLDHFLDDDDEHESMDADDDYDLDGHYANIQRARQQLMERLRRFEKLAELDPMELENKFLETSDDDEYEQESVESEKDDPPMSSLCRKQGVVADTLFVNNQQVFGLNQPSLHQHDIISRKLTDEMIELDFEREFDGWNKFTEQAAETAAELELAIFGVLVEELISEELVLNGRTTRTQLCIHTV